jgi:hypothetical protein
VAAFGSETPAFYSDRLSARPGDRVGLHISSPSSPCRVEVARVGAAREVVLTRRDVEVGDHPTPLAADRFGCGWPEAVAFEIGDWPSGYYDILLTAQDGRVAHHMLCVKPGRPTAGIALVLTTNTLHAYNYWGGRSAYCDVDALMSGRAPLADAMAGAIGELSAERPFPPMLLAPPDGMPRLVNLAPRGFEQRPWAGADTAWSKAHRQTPYDGSAGFLGKWEQAFVQWAEGEGIALDYFTDHDLEVDPGVLDAYRCVVLVGHSEYWSAGQREALEQFVDRGGGLAILSGNTAFWKVRWEDAGKRMICRKWRGLIDEPATPDATHLWSHPVFARPEAEITGLSFLYGGYHRLGLCVARGAGGYTIYRPEHWALEGCDLYYGDVIGSEIPLVGYENDGCLFDFGDDGAPRAAPRLGVPANLEIIGITPAAFAEAPSPYRPLIPPEQLAVVAEIAYGASTPEAQARMLRGHAVMASFRRGEGEVFNAGTTEWAHGLAAGDPFVTRITKNVLKRFGGL